VMLCEKNSVKSKLIETADEAHVIPIKLLTRFCCKTPLPHPGLGESLLGLGR